MNELENRANGSGLKRLAVFLILAAAVSCLLLSVYEIAIAGG